MHGFESVVGPVKGVFDKETSLNKAREHSLLRSDRPAYVTILSLGMITFFPFVSCAATLRNLGILSPSDLSEINVSSPKSALQFIFIQELFTGQLV